jgi:small subunit ribosomal protein S17e
LASVFRSKVITKIKYPSNGAHDMDRVRRISSVLISKYPDKFYPDFERNKKAVNELAKIRSKVLRNAIAGYLTSYIRKNSNQQEVNDGSSESEDVEPSKTMTDENRRE